MARSNGGDGEWAVKVADSAEGYIYNLNSSQRLLDVPCGAQRTRLSVPAFTASRRCAGFFK